MANPKLLYVNNFSGGLNKRSSETHVQAVPSRQEAAEVIEAINVEFNKVGAIVKSNGYVVQSDTPLPTFINGIYRYENSLGANELIVTAGAKIYRFNEFTGEFTEIYDGLDSAVARNYFSIFGDFLIITNGSDAPLKYDGTTVSTLGGWPGDTETEGQPTVSAVWKNRLWFAKNDSKPYRIYHSEAGDPEGWTVASGSNAIDVNINDGQFITGIMPFSDALIIYKNRAIHRVQGDVKEDFVIKPIFLGMGCAEQSTIINIGNYDQLFMTDRGEIASLKTSDVFGDFTTRVVSAKIQPVVRTVNLGSIQGKAFCINHRRKSQAWWFYPDGSSTLNNRVIVLDYETGAWTTRRGFTAVVGIEDKGFPVVTSIDGEVHKHDFGGSYGGAPIDAQVQTGWFFGNDGVTTKRVRSIDLILAATGDHNLTMDTYWNYSRSVLDNSFSVNQSPLVASTWGSALWGISLWGGDKHTMRRTISGIGNGKTLSLRFRNNAADQPFEINSVHVTYFNRGLRYGSPFPTD